VPVWDVIAQEKIHCILFEPIGEGVAVVSPYRRKKLLVLLHIQQTEYREIETNDETNVSRRRCAFHVPSRWDRENWNQSVLPRLSCGPLTHHIAAQCDHRFRRTFRLALE
jgi:hypothetical protein